VLLILVDSRSSASFISQTMVARVGLPTQKCSLATVKVANGEILKSDRVVKSMEWWANGHTYRNDTRVLELGAYDAILGYDWLRTHSPMQCDWEGKIISFEDNGEEVQLMGTAGQQGEVMGISMVQLEKMIKANDIWAFAVLEIVTEVE
jgi:hypothetical protein